MEAPRTDTPPTETVPASESGRGLVGKLAPAFAAVGAVGALEVLRRKFQHRQTFVPEPYPTGIWDPSPYGLDVEDVWFESAEAGEKVHGWWIPTRRAKGTVLYCHGNAGNITSRIGVYQFLQRVGLNVLTFDYRGYGRSEGTPSEKGVYADARAAHDFLTGDVGTSAEELLVFGHSLGGAVAIDCALHRPAAGLVAQSTFTTVREMARVRFPRLPLHWIAGNQFRSLEKVSRLSLPKLFIHGTSDETIPLSLGRRLFESASEPKDWYQIQHAGHNDVYRFGGLRYLWRLIRFSRRSLRSARASGVAPPPGES